MELKMCRDRQKNILGVPTSNKDKSLTELWNTIIHSI